MPVALHRDLSTRLDAALLLSLGLLVGCSSDDGDTTASATDVVVGTDTGGTTDTSSADVLADTGPPDVSKPDVSKPDVSKPDAGEPDVVTPDVVTPDVVTPDVVTPDTVEPDVSQPDTGPPPGVCEDYLATKRPYFGDLHVHTSFSFDSYGVGNTMNDPAAAYRFAKGEEVGLPPFAEDGTSSRTLKIGRPLDFTAVTDHSEYIGEVTICNEEGTNGYNSPTCVELRDFRDFEEDVLGGDVVFAGWGANIAADDPMRIDLCGVPGVNCEAATQEAWSRIQGMTEAANDPCTFTALHAYEWTATVSLAMNHRNVIYRSDTVPDKPLSFFEVQNWHDLALGLRSQCDALGEDCDVIAIPHNPNYSEGAVFLPTDREGNALTAATAKLRQEMEVAVEIVQTKQESECRNGFTAYPGAEDEFCNFEKVFPRTPFCAAGETACASGETPDDTDCVICTKECGPDEVAGCEAPRDYVRNTLKLGMEVKAATGVNPYRLGFVGGTDTHAGTPGAVQEQTFEGHHGATDDELDEHLAVPASGGFLALSVDANPGGLAAVWAEENTRAAIFDGLRNRESYATSGTRISLRFFGGWSYGAGLCDATDFAEQAYAGGVPMGGELGPRGPMAGAPTFAIQAMRDAGDATFPGVPLQRAHIIKVWLAADGTPMEKVYDVTPNPDYTATVDTDTCVVSAPMRDTICTVWEDPDFDPALDATYYTRVLEVPTCRWHRYKCMTAGIDCTAEPENGCCDPAIPKSVQERAWSSPIWYAPAD